MITLKQWMELVNYKVTEGSEYQWRCFGYDAYSLDSWSGDNDGFSMSITFDTKTQCVYMVEAFDYKNERAYRFINRDYSTPWADELAARGLEDNAWDELKFIELELEEDWLDKAAAIFNGEDYDTGVLIPLDIPDAELLTYMKKAHEMNITFNDLVHLALVNAIEEHKLKTAE
jgi:hypothetical protein